jgi:Holliday junction DNA helicase RuvB
VERLTPEVARVISERAVGNPRVAKTYYLHSEAIAVCRGHVEVTTDDVLKCFELLDVDRYGLTRADRRVMACLVARGNTPAGSLTLAASAQVSRDDLAEIIEPKLLTLRILTLTPRGRQLTEWAFEEFRTVPVQ